MSSIKVVLAVFVLGVGMLFSGCAAMDSYYSTHNPNDDYEYRTPGWGVGWGGSPGRASWDNYYGYQSNDSDLLYDWGPRRGE